MFRSPRRGGVLVLCFAAAALARPGAAQDFTIGLAANASATRVAVQGGSATFSLATAATSGAPQTVSLSVSGLPAGATATFLPATVNAGSLANLVVATSLTSTPQSSVLTVTGTYPGGAPAHTVQVTLLVIAVPLACVPRPGGFGYPDWWSRPPAHLNGDTPFDDRWAGSMALDFGDGSNEAEFRALYKEDASGKKALYFQWLVNVDPALGGGQPSLFVGIAPGPATTDALVVQVLPTVTGSSTLGLSPRVRTKGDGALSLNAYRWTAGWNLDTPPAWIEASAGVWMRPVTDTSHDFTDIGGPEGAAAKNQWAVFLAIPIDTDPAKGVNITPSSFRMWHYADVSSTTLGTSIPYTWPRTPQGGLKDFIYEFDNANLFHLIPDPGNWGGFTTSSAGCSGLTISTVDIGTTNANQSYIDVIGNNTFFAKPKDVSGAPVPQDSVVATFRFANWGSQIGTETPLSWASPPQLLPPPDNGLKGPPVAGGEITGSWQLTTAQRCRFTGTKTLTGSNGLTIPPLPNCAGNPQPCCSDDDPELILHQCMLVKLRASPTGGALNFLRDSAVRNMDFVKASRFERLAEVSVRGLPDLAGGKRDVYVFVEALNMPAFGFGSGALDLVVPTDPRAGSAPRQKEPRAPALGDVMAKGSRAPMLVVHAYHDTGEKARTRNGERRLLFPQTSFGYVVEHDGPLEGWLWDIGAEPVPGVPNLYKVSVPNGGSVKILNVIEAVEPKRFGLALHGGIAIPHGSFSSTHTLGPAGALDIEYMFSGHWAALVQLGIDDFPGKSGQPRTTAYRVSANAKTYLLDGRFRLFLMAGAGAYRFDPGQTKAGADIGAGVQYILSHGFALEGTYLFHGIANATPTTTYSNVLVGARFRF